MKRSILLTLLLLGAFAVSSLSAGASTIVILNADFRQLYTDSSETTPITLNDGQYTVGFGTTMTDTFGSVAGYVPEWSDTPHDNYIFGLDHRAGGPFPSATFGNAVYSKGRGTLLQNLSVTIADNSTYTLTLQVGNDSRSPYGNPTVELLAGGTPLIPTSSVTPPPATDTFENWTFTYTTGDVVNTDFLSIQVTNTGDVFQLDNVDLTVVPEPSSMAFFAAGMVIMLAQRLRCLKAEFVMALSCKL